MVYITGGYIYSTYYSSHYNSNMSKDIFQLTEPVCDSRFIPRHYQVVIFQHRLFTVFGGWLDGSDVSFIQLGDTEQSRGVYSRQLLVSL